MKKTVLDNGFEIYTETIDVAKTVTFSIYIKAGSYQEVEPFGVAHLLEHMVFKGTEKRNAQQISEDIEKYGGYMNAETSFDYTRYFTTIPYENWKKGSEVICDISFNSTIPDKEFSLEKKVVQEELKMYADDSSSHVNDMLLREMFKSYPNRQTLGGTVESVEKITKNHLIDFKNKYYNPSNMFAVVTGNVKHEEVVVFLTDIISGFGGENIVDLRNKEFKVDILNSKTVSKERVAEQAHLSWGLFGPSEGNEDSFAVDVAATILGGSSTSKLYKIIREQMGLAYTVNTNYMGLNDVGLIIGYAGLDKSNVEPVKGIVVDEFEKLTKDMVSQDDLERAKNYISGMQKTRLDNLPSINSYIGSSIISNISTNPDDYIKGINSVTRQDILRVAKKYFTKENWQFSQITPK